MKVADYKYTFTVFTAAHNSARILYRVYDSLKAQTFRDFEWLIVDDGSTDQTEALVGQWQREVDFPIRYVWQEHGGKHTAVNHGVREAQGELFLNLDHDDACSPIALERFKFHWDRIPADQKEAFVGVTALTQDPQGNIWGSSFPFDPTDSDSLEIRFRYKVTGEKWGFLRTEIMREFPYPELPGETYVPESLVWKCIALKYKTRYVNEVLRTFFPTPHSLGDRNRAVSNPAGSRLYYGEFVSLDYYIPVKFLLRGYVNYVRFSCHEKIGLVDQIRAIPSPLHWVVTFPVGFLIYLLDCYRWKRSNA